MNAKNTQRPISRIQARLLGKLLTANRSRWRGRGSGIVDGSANAVTRSKKSIALNVTG